MKRIRCLKRVPLKLIKSSSYPEGIISQIQGGIAIGIANEMLKADLIEIKRQDDFEDDIDENLNMTMTGEVYVMNPNEWAQVMSMLHNLKGITSSREQRDIINDIIERLKK